MDCAFLIVDADRNFREVLAIALRLDGISVEVTDSAEEALALLGRREVGCCVVDAHLAGADALVRAAGDAGVRTVLTGPYADLLAVAVRRHPRAEPLAKPFQLADLTGRGGGRPRSPAAAAR